MSASSNVARRAVARNPLLVNLRVLSSQRTLSTTFTRHVARNAQVPAVALLIPQRYLSTDHHRTDASQSGPPPPGFDAEKAKKPLPKDSAAAASKSESAKDAKSKDDTIEPDHVEPAKTAVEADMNELAAKKEDYNKEAQVTKKDKEERKLTLWEKVKKEAHHYWDGSKLLVAEVKISWRLALKMAAGYELTRRENRQLQRTVQDLGRLVPFSVFIIVPLGEALLPLALKLFPNMLPSTFEGQKSKDAKATLLRSTRKEVSTFLQQTLGETGLPLSQATAEKEEFSNFFRKVRSTGETPTAEDVVKVCKVFRDDLTLDNLSRPQLVSMCRYMALNTFGTDMMLRYQIRHRMRQIKRDDKAIAYEGVESLTVSELRMAAAARGIRTHSVSPARMREDLQAWLDLRLKDGVPSTLLVLSNAYMYGQGSGEGSSQIDALIGVLSSIPEELYHEIELEMHSAEGAATNKQRLEVLKEQQELIEEENAQDEESQSTGMATPRDTEDIDEKEERQMSAEAEGLAKNQAGEMVDAETDMANAEKQQKVAAKEEQK
ncbi:LETM1-like protein [Sarocladium implicatum]|nr:LETM1-like protein [Sarocladium implicatum]